MFKISVMFIEIAKVIILLALVLVGIAFTIFLLITVVEPKKSVKSALTKRVSGCIRSSAADPSLNGITTASCDYLGTTYTEYYCDDVLGCKDPNSDEIFFGSKITTEPCQPKCMSNLWDITTLQECKYDSELQGNNCVESGEIPKKIRKYTCVDADKKGMPGCIIVGDQSLISQFLTAEPEKCTLVPDLNNTVKCDTGAMVTVTENCQIPTALPICGEYRVRTVIRVQDPSTEDLYPPNDSRSIDFKKCSSNNVGLMDLKSTCYKPNKTGPYSSIVELFNVGVSRIPTECVKVDSVDGKEVFTTTGVVCKKPTNVVETGPLYLPGDLDYNSTASTTPLPDCLQTCLYYGVPSVPNPTTFENFSPIVGKYFVMIVHIDETINSIVVPKRYILSNLRSLARHDNYIGVPSSLPFGDMLGKSGKYNDIRMPMAMIDLDEVLANKGTYGIMTSNDPSKIICDEAVVMETNAAIFVGDYNTTVSPTKYRFELYSYHQNKLGFVSPRPFGGGVYSMEWTPISEDVAFQNTMEPTKDISDYNISVVVDQNFDIGINDPSLMASITIAPGSTVVSIDGTVIGSPIPGKYGTIDINSAGVFTYTRITPLGGDVYEGFLVRVQDSSSNVWKAYIMIRTYTKIDIYGTYVDLEYVSDITPQPDDSLLTIRKMYNLNFAGYTKNSRPVPVANVDTVPFGAGRISRVNDNSMLIDITKNNTLAINGPDIQITGIEIVNVGERLSNFGVQPKIDIPTIIGGRVQRTAYNCNLFYRLPVPTDYNY